MWRAQNRRKSCPNELSASDFEALEVHGTPRGDQESLKEVSKSPKVTIHRACRVIMSSPGATKDTPKDAKDTPKDAEDAPKDAEDANDAKDAKDTPKDAAAERPYPGCDPAATRLRRTFDGSNLFRRRGPLSFLAS